MQISVIVPAYNAESSIAATLASLLAQDFDGYEIVCVNDGSTDGTGTVLASFAEGHPSRIRAINQENAGVWAARQTGVLEAKGEYLAFCDSDDLVAHDWLSSLYEGAITTGAQICVCGFSRIEVESSRVLSTEMCWQDGTIDRQADAVLLPLINSALWNKLIRASFLNTLPALEVTPRVSEDALLVALALSQASRIAFVPRPLYRYQVYATSAIQTLRIESLEEVRTAFVILRDFLQVKAGGAAFQQTMDRIAFVQCGIALPLLVRYPDAGAVRVLQGQTIEYLDAHFPSWRRGFPARGLLRRGHGMAYARVLLAQVSYRLRIFHLLARGYQWMTRRLRLSVKW